MDLSTSSILIIEDDFSFALFLESKLAEWGAQHIKVAGTLARAAEVLEQEAVDIAIVDIHLDDGMGWQLFQDGNFSGYIIYLTKFFDQDHFKSVAATLPGAFISKNDVEVGLYSAVEIAVAQQSAEQENNEDWIFKSRNAIIKIPIREIDYIQSDGNYCYFYHKSKKYVKKVSLAMLMSQLPAKKFIRIHKSYIINFSLVNEVDLKNFRVKLPESELPIGRNFRTVVKQAIYNS